MTAVEQLQDIQLQCSTMPEANTMLCVSWGYIKVCGGLGVNVCSWGETGCFVYIVARSSIYLNIASD